MIIREHVPCLFNALIEARGRRIQTLNNEKRWIKTAITLIFISVIASLLGAIFNQSLNRKMQVKAYVINAISGIFFLTLGYLYTKKVQAINSEILNFQNRRQESVNYLEIIAALPERASTIDDIQIALGHDPLLPINEIIHILLKPILALKEREDLPFTAKEIGEIRLFCALLSRIDPNLFYLFYIREAIHLLPPGGQLIEECYQSLDRASRVLFFGFISEHSRMELVRSLNIEDFRGLSFCLNLEDKRKLLNFLGRLSQHDLTPALRQKRNQIFIECFTCANVGSTIQLNEEFHLLTVREWNDLINLHPGQLDNLVEGFDYNVSILFLMDNPNSTISQNILNRLTQTDIQNLLNLATQKYGCFNEVISIYNGFHILATKATSFEFVQKGFFQLSPSRWQLIFTNLNENQKEEFVKNLTGEMLLELLILNPCLPVKDALYKRPSFAAELIIAAIKRIKLEKSLPNENWNSLLSCKCVIRKYLPLIPQFSEINPFIEAIDLVEPDGWRNCYNHSEIESNNIYHSNLMQRFIIDLSAPIRLKLLMHLSLEESFARALIDAASKEQRVHITSLILDREQTMSKSHNQKIIIALFKGENNAIPPEFSKEILTFISCEGLHELCFSHHTWLSKNANVVQMFLNNLSVKKQIWFIEDLVSEKPDYFIFCCVKIDKLIASKFFSLAIDCSDFNHVVEGFKLQPKVLYQERLPFFCETIGMHEFTRFLQDKNEQEDQKVDRKFINCNQLLLVNIFKKFFHEISIAWQQ